MENTASFIFDDTDARYFVAIRGKAFGPLTAQEVYERIRSGEASLLHYYWLEGMPDWGRINENKEFQILVPQKPSLESIAKIREKVAKKKRSAAVHPEFKKQEEDPEKKTHFLFFNNSQYGPFSKKEMVRVLESGKVQGKAYVWMPGWPNWKNLAEVEEWASFAPPPQTPGLDDDEKPVVKKSTKKQTSERADRRGGPRRPLIAKLFVHNDDEVIMAVCRDISVGGMQVLTDRVPGAVGSTVKLNVSPSDAAKSVKGFVAEGEIVRILEDGRGFSFRFTKISADAKKTIEKYLKTDE